MPSCSLKHCSSRRNKNQPQLSVHSFPKSNVTRGKWLKAVGEENINTRHKELRLCSLHFEESQLNRTLKIVRLCDNAVPTLFLRPPSIIHEQVATVTNSLRQPVAPDYETASASRHATFLCETGNMPMHQGNEKLPPASEKPSTSKDGPLLFKYPPKENLPLTGDKASPSQHVTFLCETGNKQVHQAKENLPPACERPSTSKDGPLFYKYPPKENLPITGDKASVSQHATFLCETGNMQVHQAKENLPPACERPSTSKHGPLFYKYMPQENLLLTCDKASPSQHATFLCETGNMQVYQAKENLPPACERIDHHSQKILKLQKVCDEQKKKIKRLNEKIRRQGKKISCLQEIVTDLKQKMIINTEESILLEQCSGSQDFLKRQIAKSKGLPLERKYSEEIRKFALTLHFLSPKAYDFIRRVYNTCLPHPRTLSQWYQHVNADAGFTKEAFETLKKKVEQNGTRKILCALTLDEIAIRKGLTWDPKAQKYHGRVDYGHNIDCDSFDVANQCLVFLLTCVNGSWKLPIGYFFITHFTGEQKSILVETAIKLTEDTGCQVVSVTCDGPAANFSMLTDLGCQVTKTQELPSFVTSNNNVVHAFIDPCHAIKLIRNTLGDLRVLIDGMGRKIDFLYLELLLKLQEDQGLHLATKVSKAHIFFEKQKMKVRLATQLLSSSVADALLFCKTELKLTEFEDCEGTANFINLVNNVFDVLNSHSLRPPGLKKAMCPANIGFIRALFESAIDYFRALRFPSGELLVESRRKTGFVGLIIDMQSALNLYKDTVEGNLLNYLPMYKVSQDHIELFFSAIRARGGFNNNPNAVQFRAAYKKLLVRAEIRDGGIGNCIPLEQINILTCSSKNPVQSLNELTEKNRFIEITDDHSDLYDEYIEAMSSDTNSYKHSVLEYISGFICRKLSKSLTCEDCLALLSGPKNYKSLTYLKSRGGLVYASDDVIEIVKKTEYVVEHHLDGNKQPDKYYMYIFQFLVEFYGFDNKVNVFATKNPIHDATHRILLIKSVIKIFLDLRYRHHGKKATEKLSCRNYFNKLVLFRNE